MLGLVSKERLDELVHDEPFVAFLELGVAGPRAVHEQASLVPGASDSALGSVAYFSPEFGVSEALPIYSGGLGVLAGDHLKAASDLGVPLVGVGLLYRQGYFRQHLNADGWQQESYPALDPHGMPLKLLTGDDGQPLKIEVELAGAAVWRRSGRRRSVGFRSSCSTATSRRTTRRRRVITDRLYGGGTEHRLRQEIVLGIGGVRALQAAGYDPDVFHSNEGHAGFLGLERIRQLVNGHGMTPAEAMEAVRAGTVFTTHTPVPAGIDVYDVELMERYFTRFAKECDLTFEELMQIGQVKAGGDGGVVLQHGGDGAAPRRLDRTPSASCTASCLARSSQSCGRRFRSTRCRSVPSRTASTPRRGSGRRWPKCSIDASRRIGPRPGAVAGSASPTSPMPSCGERANERASGSSTSSATGSVARCSPAG